MLSLSDSITASFALDIPLSSPTHEDKSLASYYATTDPDCPAITHTVFKTISPNVSPSSSELENFQIATVSGENFLRIFPAELGLYDFYVEGKTVSDKVAYKPMQLRVKCGPVS